MKMNDYQNSAMATAIYPGHTTTADARGQRSKWDAIIARSYVALKLNGEAGEVAEHIGKAIRDDDGIITSERREKLKHELGDVLWYVAALAQELGFDLSDIADANIAKLHARKAAGTLQGSGSDR